MIESALDNEREQGLVHAIGRHVAVVDAQETPYLGNFYWYSIPVELDVHFDRLTEIAKNARLPMELLPAPARSLNAFKGAYQGLSEDITNRPPSGGRRISVRINQRQCQVDVLQHAAAGPIQQAGGFVLGSIAVAPRKPTLQVEHADWLEANPEAQRLFQQVAGDFCKRYQRGLWQCNHKHIGKFLVRAAKVMKAVLVRDSGGVYFAPRENRSTLDAVNRFMRGLGCEFVVHPVNPSEVDGAWLARKAEEDLVKELRLVLEEVNRLKAAGAKIGALRMAGLQSRIRCLEEKREHYSELLQNSLGGALRCANEARAVVEDVQALVVE